MTGEYDELPQLTVVPRWVKLVEPLQAFKRQSLLVAAILSEDPEEVMG